MEMTSAKPSLPPMVTGRLCGHLVMKIDEVVWTRKPPGEVSAVILWWGGEIPTTFRPSDVSENDTQQFDKCVVYEILTSRDLFEDYLMKCGNMKVAVADKYGMPIGCATVVNLSDMMHSSPHQGYYPIINSFGNRIGDIHVSFNLQMSPQTASVDKCIQSSEESVMKSKESEPSETNVGCTVPKLNLKGPTTVGAKRRGNDISKDDKMRRNKQVSDSIKNTGGSSHGKENGAFETHCGKSNSDKTTEAQKHSHPACSNKKSGINERPVDNIITQILEDGRRLRDAMTMSVLEDGSPLELSNFPMGRNLDKNEIEPERMVSHTPNTEPLKFRNFTGTKMSAGKAQYHGVNEKKVIDYLCGKPLTEVEEKEALETLRSMTPTQDFLEKVIDGDDNCKECVWGWMSKRNKEGIKGNKPNPEDKTSQDSKDEEVMKVIEGGDTGKFHNEKKSCDIDIDSELLSKVNSMRITVHSILLNAVGLKRIGASNPRQQVFSKGASSTQPPPGVTYFVEYQLPQSQRLDVKRWSNDVVRYCSKRQSGHDFAEIVFGDRSTHNIPATDRDSLIYESTLASFIVSLTFKVCARHLNQRVPVLLGSAAPDSAVLLLASAHLRHDYELPVIASDNLPVAQLRVSLELGRDRIHFGGLFDPGEPLKGKKTKENNSLGIASPSVSATTLTKKTKPLSVMSTASAGVKTSNRAATVTRNTSQKLSSTSVLWRDKQAAQQAAHANSVVDQLVTDAQTKAKCGPSWHSSTTQSSQRTESSSTVSSMKVSKEEQAHKFSSYNMKPVQSIPSSVQVPTVNGPVRYVQHDLSLCIEQIKGCVPLSGPACLDRDCFVSYKFPFWDASKECPVEWRSWSTEPTVSLQDTWFRKKNNIHTVVLEESISFYTFLVHAFKQQNTLNNPEVIFSVCDRQYGAKVQDSLTAQAFLPISTLNTLEETFCGAAGQDPDFNESSCSSVSLGLPLQLSPSYSHIGGIGRGQLRVKVDYRHSLVMESKTAGSHISQGDRIKSARKEKSEEARLGLAKTDVQSTNHKIESPEHASKLSRGPSTPNWARSPERRVAPGMGSSAFTSYNAWRSTKKTPHNTLEVPTIQMSSGMYQNRHASWQTVMNFPTVRGTVPQYHLDDIPLYRNFPQSLYSFRAQHSPHKSMMDLRSAHLNPAVSDFIFKDRDVHFKDLSLRTLRMTSTSVSCEDLYSQSYGEFSSHRCQDVNVENSDTVFDNKRREVSLSCQPVSSESHSVKEGIRLTESETKSTNIGKVLCSSNRAQQPTATSVNVGIQTSPHPLSLNMSSQNVVAEFSEINLIDLTSDIPKDENKIMDADIEPITSVDDCNKKDITITEIPEESCKQVEDDVNSNSPNDFVECIDTAELDSKLEVEVIRNQKENIQLQKKYGGLEPKTPVFRANVGVESALHLCTTLPPEIPSELDSAPHTYVTFHPSQTLSASQSSLQSESKLHATPAVPNQGEPRWHWHCETSLPVDLLVSGARLVFKVWQREVQTSSSYDAGTEADHLLGFAAVDLTVLAAGLPLVSGWFNIMDFGGVCRGQIKLSIEPLEDIKKWKNTAISSIQSQSVTGNLERQSAPNSSMYIAHCAYPEFPSHVAQYPDIHVQKMETLSQDEAFTAVLSGYQVLLQHCQRLSNELPIITSISNSGASLSPSVSLQRKEEEYTFENTDRLKDSLPVLGFTQSDVCGSVKDGLKEGPSPKSVNSTSSTTLEPVSSIVASGVFIEKSTSPVEDVDYSQCLREKLSELDVLTRMMKERLTTAVQFAHRSRNDVHPSVASDDSETCNGGIKNAKSVQEVQGCEKQGKLQQNKTGGKICVEKSTDSENSPLSASASQVSGTVSSSITPRNVFDAVERGEDSSTHYFERIECSAVNPHLYSGSVERHHTNLEIGNRESTGQKSRKTWEKHDEFIDFDAIQIGPLPQNSNPVQLDEWLSDSALHYVFNPLLFHDLMNSMQEENQNSQVVEDNELEDEEFPQPPSCSSGENEKTPRSCSISSEPIMCRRGDETYRKETSCISSSQQTLGSEKRGASAADTDSGVDVNLPGSLQSKAGWLQNDGRGAEHITTLKSCGDSSSDKSAVCYSKQHHSSATSPMSTSVSSTPIDSPQRCRQAPEGGNPIELAVRSQIQHGTDGTFGQAKP